MTIELAEVKELLNYDSETGALTWQAPRTNRVKPGDVAGQVNKVNGARYVSIGDERVLAHRLVWFMHYARWPIGNVIPINGDRLDLSIANLKEEPAQATALRSKSRREGMAKGVSWDKAKQKWFAYIHRNYKMVALGRFDTIEEAVAARQAAEANDAAVKVSKSNYVERQQQTRTRMMQQRLWASTVNAAGGMTGWQSKAEFLADVWPRPSDGVVLFAPESNRPIGPDNFVWVDKIPSMRDDPAQWRRDHKGDRVPRDRARGLQRSFGIDVAEYQRMFVAQKGVCAMCAQPETETRGGKTKWLAVDHDHDNGMIRGLLCKKCNVGIGYLGHSTEILRAAIDYLERTDPAVTEPNVVRLKAKEKS